jgi:hypothetical protein
VLWTQTKFFNQTAWYNGDGHYLVLKDDHWELINPRKDGIIASYALREDNQPPLPAANKRLGPKPCYETAQTLRRVSEPPADLNVTPDQGALVVYDPSRIIRTISVSTDPDTTKPDSLCSMPMDES